MESEAVDNIIIGQAGRQTNFVVQQFMDFANKYDLENKNVRLKYRHSFDVAKTSLEISKQLGLNDEDCYLAYVIGLLHDISRFEQWKQFQTYVDKDSFDHGDYAYKALIEEGLIKKFSIDEKYHEIIGFAIKNHNKLKINEMEIPSDSKLDFMLHAKIIRDADKLDIFEVFKRNEMPSFVNETPATGLTKEVYEAFKNKTTVDLKHRNSILDRAVSSLLLYYDLNFACSKEKFFQKEYHKAIYKNFENNMNGEDRQTHKDINREFIETERGICMH